MDRGTRTGRAGPRSGGGVRGGRAGPGSLSGRGSLSGLGPTGRAQAPVDDVRHLDLEAVVLVRVEARGLPDRTGDILEPAARATDEVVVVIVPVQLVAHAAPADGH